MTTHVLAECMRDAAIVRASIKGPIIWYTTTPMVMETLHSATEKVIWLDSELSPACGNAIGAACQATVQVLEPLLKEAAQTAGTSGLSAYLCQSIQMLLVTLSAKRLMLEKFSMRPGEKIVAGYNHENPKTAHIGVGMYDTLFRTLAEDVNSIKVHDTNLHDTSNLASEVDEIILWDQILSQLDLSRSQRVSRRLRFLANKRLNVRQSKGTIFIGRENDSIREILPYLIDKGYSLAVAPIVKLGTIGDEIVSTIKGNVIADVLKAELAKNGITLDTNRIAKLTYGRIQYSSRFWKSSHANAIRVADNIVKEDGAGFLSNTISGVCQTLLAEALRERDVPIIVAEHGVSAGLSRMHETIRDWAEPIEADLYLTCTDKAAAFYKNTPTLVHVTYKTIGLSKKTRTVPLKKLQRCIARMRLAAKPQDRVVMYLTRSIQNNFRKASNFPEDSRHYLHQKSMLHDVMPKLTGIPTIKLYSTRRTLDPDPLFTIKRSPYPAKTLRSGDFRYLRAGADLIILESPLSTLGWALGSNIPVIYLLDPDMPLLNDAQTAIENAMFVINLAHPNWRDKVIAVANQSNKEIAQLWAAKEPARRILEKNWIFGPLSPGNLGAEAIDSFIGAKH